MGTAPPGFALWLDKHMELHDPILRARRERQGLDHAAAPIHAPAPNVAVSYRCWEDQCMHFVYGFVSPADRDQHGRLHDQQSRKDSGISPGSAGPVPLLQNPPPYRQPSKPQQHMTAVQLPRLSVPSSLPPLEAPQQLPRETREPSFNYAFGDNHSRLGKGPAEPEAESFLPPLKRTSIAQPRLESIGELHLFRADSPCLRCRIAGQEVIRHRILCAISSVLHVLTSIYSAMRTNLVHTAPPIRPQVMMSAGRLWVVTGDHSRHSWIFCCLVCA